MKNERYSRKYKHSYGRMLVIDEPVVEDPNMGKCKKNYPSTSYVSRGLSERVFTKFNILTSGNILPMCLQ